MPLIITNLTLLAMLIVSTHVVYECILGLRLRSPTLKTKLRYIVMGLTSFLIGLISALSLFIK